MKLNLMKTQKCIFHFHNCKIKRKLYGTLRGSTTDKPEYLVVALEKSSYLKTKRILNIVNKNLHIANISTDTLLINRAICMPILDALCENKK